MPKYLIIHKTTNEHVSTAGTLGEIANPLPDHLKVVEVPSFDQVTERWNAVSSQVEARSTGVNAINPPVTKDQAKAILKALLEDPPTGADPWTALQQQQCLYLLLLGLFKDLKNGNVY